MPRRRVILSGPGGVGEYALRYVLGTEGMEMLGSYVAAKHGVVGLMKTMANELGPYGIRVNAVQPGVASDEARYVTGITVPVDAGAINK
jgi:NAD(P)-dependent dehydrogenase (short-subunit alcohol dehydrogenase family)